MKDKILIFGRGFIGARLQGELGCGISDKKIYSYKDADAELKKFKPTLIINCVGNVGRNVDQCEEDLDGTLTANSFVPVILAEAALRNKIRMVHISSGCIYRYDYSKDSPIGEEKVPDFFDLFYSRTKIYAERALEVLAERFDILIARIRIPLDSRPHPRNILTKLINYKKIIDLPNSITYIPDFIDALRHLIGVNAKGIYNLVNKEPLRYPVLLDLYKKYTPAFKYEIIKCEKLNMVRTNLILSTKKLENAGFKVRGIKEVLEECVKEYIKYESART